MTKTTLYKIENEYIELISQIEDQEGEITPEQNDLLVINENQLKGKTISYKEVIDTKEAFNIRIDEEIKRLQAMKKANSSLISRLKESLLNAVKMYGDIQAGLLTFTTRKIESVEVDSDIVNKLNPIYKTVKIVETPNKTTIKEALKNGIDIPGCKLITNFNLRIK